MIKINLIGPIFGTSGYCNHVRGLANALNKLCDVRLSTQLYMGWEREVNDAELSMLKKSDDNERINVIIDLPHNWGQFCNKKNNIGFLVFEGDRIPVSWVDNIKDTRISQVWVPSTHVFNAVKNTLKCEDWEKQMIMQKIKVVPHGVNLTKFYPQEDNHLFTFLINKGFRNRWDRGGMQHGIRAFLSEFKKDEARLIIKMNTAYAMGPDQLQLFIMQTAKELNLSEIPDIAVNYENLKTDQLKELYKICDILLNPTEGEAFSLPCIEAMACGKPVITTDFGGQTDFVTQKNGWLVSSVPHEVKNELLYEGIKWHSPDIGTLRKAMREAYNEKNEDKIKNAIITAQNYTWDNSAQKALSFLKDI